MITEEKILADIGFADRASASAAPLAVVSPPAAGGATASFGGAYEGAELRTKKMARWTPANRSADMEILPVKNVADARAKDLVRNDPIIQTGSTIRKDSIIGSSYTLSAKPDFAYLGLTEDWAEKFSEEVENKFSLFANSSRNWVDASRKNNFTSMLRLAIGIDLACGESLGTAEWIQDSDRPYRTAIKLIDPDRLMNPLNTAGKDIRGGIERDKHGAAIAFHIRTAHPSDHNNKELWSWKRVPVRRPWGRQMVIHAMEQSRPDQTRGISDLIAGFSEMRMLKEFRGMTLENAIMNATFAASIESELPPAEAFRAIGANSDDVIGDTLESYLNVIDSYSSAANFKIDGVKVPHLPPGTKLNMRPAGGNLMGNDFEMSCHRYLAAILGVSYEELLHDYTNTNLSSAKAAFGNTKKYMDSRKRYTADTFANATYALWLEEAIDKGDIESMKGSNFRDMWESGTMNFEALTRAEWIGSGQASLDPIKDAQADALELKAGTTTLEEIMGRKGKDWRKTIKQRGLEMQALIDAGLPTSFEDNSLNASSGSPQTRQPTEDAENDGTSKRTKK